MRTLVRGVSLHNGEAETVLPIWGGLPDRDFMPSGVAMVLQWLSSPVVWTLIVLIMSGLGIFRELF
jgi:hypothetical protein